MLQFAKDDFLPTKANSDSGPKSLLSYIMMACEKVAVKELWFKQKKYIHIWSHITAVR